MAGAGARRGPAPHPAPDVYEPRRARDAGPGGPPDRRRRGRTVGRHVPSLRQPDAAPPCASAGLWAGLYDSGRGRFLATAQSLHRGAGAEGQEISQGAGAGQRVRAGGEPGGPGRENCSRTFRGPLGGHRKRDQGPRALRAEKARIERDGFRRFAGQRAQIASGATRRCGTISGTHAACAGGRIPGHQQAAVGLRGRDRRPAPQPAGRGRRFPEHLFVARGGSEEYPVLREALPGCEGFQVGGKLPEHAGHFGSGQPGHCGQSGAIPESVAGHAGGGCETRPCAAFRWRPPGALCGGAHPAVAGLGRCGP